MERLTKQRVYIIDAVKSLGHASLFDVSNFLKEHDTHLSTATLYRNLSSLTKDNILRKVDISSEDPLYEVVKDNPDHDHFICNVCGNVIDVPKNKYFSFIDNMGNKIETSNVNYHGVCAKCLAKGNKRD